jgi:ABC-type transport system involved in cytochrome c biogenesis permease subunit
MELVTLVDVFVVAMPVLYALVVTAYAIAFFKSVPRIERWKTPLLLVTVFFHVSYIGIRTAAFDHPPITTVYEIMTMLAACIAITYAYIELRTKASLSADGPVHAAGQAGNTGMFILALACIFQTVSSIYIKDLTEIATVLRSRLLGFHVSAALLGYTAISLSAVYGFLYLMLYHEIKSSRFGVIYSRLPNLEMLERMSSKAEVFGFIMLSVAIVVGIVWLPRAFEEFSYWDPKLVGTIGIWVLYAISLAAKRALGWQGRRMMILSVIAFGIVFLSMTVINVYLSGFHTFH